MSLRQEHSEATARKSRDAARGLFSTRSYDEVTLAAVAADAGVSVPTARSHFGRKEDLFLAGYLSWGTEAVQSREAASDADPMAAVRRLLRDYERQGEIGLHCLPRRIASPRYAR
jgi:AcrR family transcriptional regulator